MNLININTGTKSMNVNFYLSNLNMLAKQKAFSGIADIKNKEKIIILTPDRNTLNIEKEILKTVGTKSIFNLNVTTFSRLAKGFLVERGLFKNVLTKHASVALIKKILLEIKNELHVFKNNIEQDGFCEKIFETICLYKSCKITPNTFHITDKEDLLTHKLHDIYLVYSKYEEYLSSEYTDSFNQLDLFEKSVSSSDYNDTHFYLVDYEDITPSITRLVAKIAKVAKSLNICTTYSKSVSNINNANIFTNDIYYNLRNYFDMEGVASRNIYIEDNNKSRSVISKNLYGVKGYSGDKIKSINLNLLKANSVEQECLVVLSSIKKDILDGKYNLGDISLIVSSVDEYRQALHKILPKLEISYYIDEPERLDSNILCKIILWILNLSCKDINKYILLSLIDSGVLKLTQPQVNAYKKYIMKLDAKGKYLYEIPDKIDASEELVSAINIIKCFVDKLNIDSGTIDEYREYVENILDSVGYDEYYEFLYSKFVNESNIIEAKKLTQTYNKLSEIWIELSMLFKNEKISVRDFLSIFKAFIADITLSLPPIKVDSLVVLDFSNSYIEAKKHLYFLGASDMSLPKYSVETALIADREIEKLQNHNRLTPTINLINKRKKFKLYETVYKAKESLNFSYVCVDSKGEELYPTSVFNELTKFVSPNIVFADTQVALDDTNDSFIAHNITKRLALDNMATYIKEWNLYGANTNYRQNVTSVQHSLYGNSPVDLLKLSNYENKVDNIKLANKLFFRTSEVSPSQFESFARCPYSHFINYGLRLKEQERAKVSINDVGNIIHDYLRNTIYDLSTYKNDDRFKNNIQQYVKFNLDKVLNSNKYIRFIKSDRNKNIICGLFDEVERMTLAIMEQLACSDYEPMFREHSFAVKDNGCIAMTLNNGKRINVVGKVDRIDVNKDDKTFIIIDYKTGNSSFSNFTDFVSGKKIQLFVYLMLFKNMTGMKPVGAFYLPIDNKMSDAKKYRYQGFVVKNVDVIENIDNTLRQFGSVGTTLRLSRKKDGEFYQNNTWKNLSITNNAIDGALSYLVDSISERAEKIMQGKIDVLPLYVSGVSACKYCKYKGLCNFNTKYKNKYRKVENVASLQEVITIEESITDVEEGEDV